MTLHTTNDGVELVYEVRGEGAPILLLHDFMDRRSTWQHLGYTDRLLGSGRKVVTADLRGHGDSGKPRDPGAYQLERRVSDVIAILDSAGLGHVDLIGYAMGAWVAMGVVAHRSDRVRSAILGGIHPFAESLDPCRLRVKSEIAVRESLVRWHGGKRLLEVDWNNDVEALAASVIDDRSDISDLIAKSKVPMMLYLGEKDPRLPLARAFVDQSYASLVTLPKLDHRGAFAASAAALPHILRFLDQPQRRCCSGSGGVFGGTGAAGQRYVN